MAKKIQIGNAILCEYVAQGSNNKHVLVNVYSGNVIAGKLPAELTFGLYAEIIQPVGSPIDKLDLELVLGGKTFMRGVATLPGAQETSLFILPMFQIPIAEPGDFEVFFSAAGFSRTRVLKKSISVGSVPGFTLPSA